MTKEFYSNGKLLISGEYAVLDGSLALAVPTTYGQSLEITNTASKEISWISIDEKGKTWFSATFSLNNIDIIESTNSDTANILQKILLEAKKANINFLTTLSGIEVKTKLTFPTNWGLGSSSTLINNIAQWANIDAYKLLWNAFSGSAYDIACAKHNSPILYKVTHENPEVEEIDFNPSFKNQLYFVFLNKKQNSRDAIANYRKQKFNQTSLLTTITNITKKMGTVSTLAEFESLIAIHEKTISKAIKITPIKERLFHDFPGAIKSLGGWGGDFILVTGDSKTPTYFQEKGYHTVIPYKKMVL